MFAEQVRERLARAVAAHRASVKMLNQRSRAAYASALLKRAEFHLAAVDPQLRDQARMLLSELREWDSGWTADDRWAVVLEVLALLDEGVEPHVIARHLIHLGACKGTGKVTEVEACLVWIRKERHRFRQRTLA